MLSFKPTTVVRALTVLLASFVAVLSVYTSVTSASVGRNMMQNLPASVPQGGCIPPECPVYESVAVTLTPGVASTLIYTDPQGLPTRLDFPAATTAETTTVVFRAGQVTALRSDFITTGHSFELLALREDHLDKSFVFRVPVTVTIQYSDSDIQNVAEESQLLLYSWSGWKWYDSAQTCSIVSSYVRDIDHNTISVAICRLGQHGLFSTYRVYLPVIAR